MEYNIVNLEILANSEDRSYLEKYLDVFIKKMSILPMIYRKSKFIDIIFQRTDQNKLQINVSAQLNTGKIQIIQSGESIKNIIPAVFDNFTEKTAKELVNIRKKFSLDQKNAFLKLTAIDKEQLKSFDDKEKSDLFNSLIPSFIPNLNGYIKRRILSAKRAELKALSNIDYKDVVSEVIVRVFPIFKSNIKEIKNLNLWLIKTADDVLNEILDNYTSENISFEELVNSELGQLEEEFTVDAGGDLIMTEDLDEYEVDLGVEEIIIASKGENDLIEKLDISKSSLKEKIYDELIKLPLRYQSIYDLYFIEYLSYDEIAIVKNMEALEVEAIIISIKEIITEKLFN